MALVANKISNKLPREAIRTDDSGVVNLDNAIDQHLSYVETLEKMGAMVIELDVDGNEPDSVFVEDGMIFIDNKIILCNMRYRSNELKRLRDSLIKHKICDINTMPFDVHMDGGDVMIIGKDVFVGISGRTQIESIQFIKEIVSPEYKFYPITVNGGLHLKSFMSKGLGNDIIVGSSSTAKSAVEQIKSCVGDKYNFVELMDDSAANVVVCKGKIMVRSIEEFPKSIDILLKHYHDRVVFQCNNSELAKVDGALTCCSVIME